MCQRVAIGDLQRSTVWVGWTECDARPGHRFLDLDR
jgi:hypothetical protein